MFRKHKTIKNVETKSEPYDPKLFGPITQTTQINISIEEKDDGIAECLSGCFSMCIGIASKSAK